MNFGEQPSSFSKGQRLENGIQHFDFHQDNFEALFNKKKFQETYNIQNWIEYHCEI